MAQINLLPWRQQARQEKKVQFAFVLGFCVVLTLIVLVLVHFYLNGLIAEENQRNAFIQTTLGDKQGIFNSLKTKKQKQMAIEAELKFIMTLRDMSFRAVALMNELVKVVPSSVTIEKLSRENNKIILIGKAQSELQVTQLMKNISKSPVFNQPVLTRISGIPGSTDTSRVFELEVEQKAGTLQ